MVEGGSAFILFVKFDEIFKCIQVIPEGKRLDVKTQFSGFFKAQGQYTRSAPW